MTVEQVLLSVIAAIAVGEGVLICYYVMKANNLELENGTLTQTLKDALEEMGEMVDDLTSRSVEQIEKARSSMSW